MHATFEPLYIGIEVVPSGSVKTAVPNHGVHYFGELSVLDFQIAEGSFTLRNTSPAEIVISRLSASCGCTLVSIDQGGRLNNSADVQNTNVHIPARTDVTVKVVVDC
jgi:hypothetical protein